MLTLHDVVVVVPGILGSTLQRDGRDVWAPSASGVLHALRTLGGSLTSLRLPDGIGDEHPGDKVTAAALMPDLHLVPGLWTHNMGYDRLLGWLRETFAVVEPSAGNPDAIPNVLTFPYDWRLSNRYNAAQLKAMVEPALQRWRDQGGPYADAELVFLCHSMGGLIARWYVTQLGGAEITRRLVTFGTPYRGSVNALDQLVNGVRKGWGPFKVDLTRLIRSMPSAYQLLPEYACIETAAHDLLKTTETVVPELPTAMVADGMRFHETMNGTTLGHTLVYPFVGYDHPTATTARITRGKVTPIATFKGDDHGGDGTVPRLSGSPKVLELDDPSISPVNEQHGTLQHNAHVHDRLEGILRAPRGEKPRGHEPEADHGATIGIAAPADVLAGEVVVLGLTGSGERLQVTVTDERGMTVRAQDVGRARRPGGRDVAIGDLDPGAYMVTVASGESTPLARTPVHTALLVWDEEMR